MRGRNECERTNGRKAERSTGYFINQHQHVVHVLFREKEKNEIRDEKVFKILETKDLQIQQLERVRISNDVFVVLL